MLVLLKNHPHLHREVEMVHHSMNCEICRKSPQAKTDGSNKASKDEETQLGQSPNDLNCCNKSV